MPEPTEETDPWTDARIDREIARARECADAFTKIGEALKHVPVERRGRVIRAMAVLYDVDLPPPRGAR